MGLFAAIWQKVVWCGLVGGIIGMAMAVVELYQKEPGKAALSSLPSELILNALVGTLFGLVLLGVPASLWVVAKWAIHGGKLEAAHVTAPIAGQPAVHHVGEDAGRGAMIGSTAAIPGAIVGALAGVALAVMLLGVLMFVSFLTGAPYFGYTLEHFLVVGFGSAAAIGATLGFLGGTFFGSALGALFGGVRALARH